MKTYWNGQPCKAEKVMVIVGPPLKPTWWCAALEGKEYPAIKITQDGESFYIADDEHGWAKITEGQGSFMYSHKSLPVEKEVIPSGSSPTSEDELAMMEYCRAPDEKAYGYLYLAGKLHERARCEAEIADLDAAYTEVCGRELRITKELQAEKARHAEAEAFIKGLKDQYDYRGRMIDDVLAKHKAKP